MGNNRLVSLCVCFVLCCSVLFAQENPHPRAVLGIRYTANYTIFRTNEFQDNYHVFTSLPAVLVEFNQHHEIHTGMILAHLINPSWYSHIYYQKNAKGFFIGYRYSFDEIAKHLRLFGQIYYSCIYAKYRGSSLGSGINDNLSNRTLIGGHISAGADYRLAKHISLQTGVGAGFSTGSEYGLFDKILSPFLGIDYRF